MYRFLEVLFPPCQHLVLICGIQFRQPPFLWYLSLQTSFKDGPLISMMHVPQWTDPSSVSSPLCLKGPPIYDIRKLSLNVIPLSENSVRNVPHIMA